MPVKTIKWIFAALLCLALTFSAAAAEIGSLRVETKPKTDVILHRVAETDGSLTKKYTAAGISKKGMLDSKKAVTNARTLLQYVQKQGIKGKTETTDDKGSALFDGLLEGMYLVYCEDEELFDPFLVSVPTVINGEKIHQIKAEPKSEEPDPTAPPAPGKPDKPKDPDPNIPQTGENIWPKCLLLAFGVILMTAGSVELVRGRKEAHE